MPTKIVPKNVHDPDPLADAILAIEKGRGTIIQVVDQGETWCVIYTARPKQETR